MRRIIEIRISNHLLTPEQQWNVIREVHKKVLCKDKNWHFFYEVFYNIIRCSIKYANDVKDVLDSLKVNYEDRGRWVDEQEATKKYQTHFKKIFHEYAELIMKMDNIKDAKALYRELWMVSDRVIHCFLINCNYIAEPWKKEARQSFSWEGHIMTSLTTGRIAYNRDFIGSCEEKVDLKDYNADGYSYNLVPVKTIPIRKAEPLMTETEL